VVVLCRAATDLALENDRLRRYARRMERRAMTDPLTRLPNRRAIEARAQAEIRRLGRHPSPLAVGLIDIDHFKEINRRYLWPGGDQALIATAQTISGSLRESDCVGRVGGEEFMVVVPDADLAGASLLAERIRAAVERLSVNYDGQVIRLTVSVGFAAAETG
jgi:diguanylate cyclase (GGDEF)-like protein